MSTRSTAQAWLRSRAMEVLMVSLGVVAFVVDALRPAPMLPPVDSAMSRIEVPSAPGSGAAWSVPDGVNASAVRSALDEARWIRSEILYREALRLGLDQSDVIVRRRLVQKMDYLLDGMADIPEITDADLAAYYRQHIERYRYEPTYAFEHVFFSLQQGSDDALARAQAALAQLKQQSRNSAATLGDPYPDGSRFEELSGARVLQLFGEPFLLELNGLRVGEWTGPIRSNHGLHLVHRTAITPAATAPLEAVRAAVVRDMVDELRRWDRERIYEQIKARYDIVRS